MIQATLMHNLAYNEALPYFQYVIQLMLHIENVLIENDKKLKAQKACL